jgi:adenylate cyclase, class 2
MAIETEKKYRLTKEQYEQIRAALEDFGAEFTGEDFEENTLYGGDALDEQRAVLRVRRVDAKTVLTYKRRIQNNLDIKQQIEHETEVKDAAALANIIESLGFAPRLVYEKRRKTWKFRQAEVVLDELPFGLFMEIEGSITAIAEAEMLLEAEDFAVEHETYPNLTGKFGAQNDGIVEARFSR